MMVLVVGTTKGVEVASESVVAEPVAAEETGLARHVLSEVQVLAESIGMIGPSLGASALIPLAFAQAGGASWLTVVIATLGMFAVAFVISELARRHVSMGALYTLIPKGLGPSGGLLAAGGFVLIALAGQIISVLGFGAALAQFLNSAFNIGSSSRAELVVLDLAGLFLASLLVLRGIRLSTSVLLVLEAISMTAISVLLIVVVAKHGDIFDAHQLKLEGATAHGVLVATTFLVLAFGGFESATALGFEAREPRRAIPIALFGSIAVVGVFFLVNAYIQILGFEGTGLKVADQAVPLGSLSDHYGVKWLGDIVLLGVTLSWFGVLCAWLNYAPRPLVAMADEGVLPKWLGRTNRRTGVPQAAVLFWAATYFVITLYLVVRGTNLTEAFANIAVLAGYGYTLLYLLVAIAAVGYALRGGLRRISFVVAALVAGGVMVLVYWYSFNPLPDPPIDSYVYGFAIFVAALVVGTVLAWLVAPDWLRRMGRIEEADGGS
jgi:amino acid transporter